MVVRPRPPTQSVSGKKTPNQELGLLLHFLDFLKIFQALVFEDDFFHRKSNELLGKIKLWKLAGGMLLLEFDINRKIE